MKRIAHPMLVAAALFAVVGCNNDKSTPGYTFMDDMYVGPAIETYEPSALFADGLGSRKPVEGTVARGQVPYAFPNTTEGYEAARTTLMMPEAFKTAEALEKGKVLYGIFCVSCHGEKGDGQGWLVQQEKILGVPSYDKTRLPDITPGSMYHVIMHGKGIMGSHASQLTYDERWQIVRYVVMLREGETADAPQSTSADSTQTTNP